MLRTYLRINRVGLVGAARLSPEWTSKVGTVLRPGRRGRQLGASRDRKHAAEQRGIGAWDDPKSQGWPAHHGHPVEIHTRAANMHF